MACRLDNVLISQGEVTYKSFLEVKGLNLSSPCGFRAISIVCEISPLLSYAGEVSVLFFFANNATRNIKVISQALHNSSTSIVKINYKKYKRR